MLGTKADDGAVAALDLSNDHNARMPKVPLTHAACVLKHLQLTVATVIRSKLGWHRPIRVSLTLCAARAPLRATSRAACNQRERWVTLHAFTRIH